jgi:hypothetical protein
MAQDWLPSTDGSDEGAKAARIEARRLASFGLTRDICHQISSASLIEYGRAPARGSANAGGTYAYQGALSEMTAQFEEIDYERKDVNNLPVFLHLKQDTAVILTSGNSATGREWSGVHPTSRYPKGQLTHRLISTNVMPGQVELGGSLSLVTLIAPAGSKSEKTIVELLRRQVWLYVVHFDFSAMEIRSEISLPASKQSGRYVSSWLSRIPISPYLIKSTEIGEDGTEINFPVDPL